MSQRENLLMGAYHTFTYPAALQDFRNRVDTADTAEQQDLGLTLHLKLLYALNDEDILAACRGPGSRYAHDQEGNRTGCLTKREYLDIGALGQAWRRALRSLPLNNISKIVFDGCLPPDSTQRAVHAIGFDSTITDGGVGVPTQQYVNLVDVLATVSRMRSGAAICFEVVFDVDPRRPNRASIVRLEQLVRALSGQAL